MSAGSRAAAAPGRRPTVLIVVDDVEDVRLLERVLGDAGLATASTPDPREVVPLVRSVAPDLILLKLQLPVMDGFQVLERLSGVIRDDELLPVMALTSDPSSTARHRALAAGASDVVNRPYDPDEVVLRAGSLLRSRALYVDAMRRGEALQAQVQQETHQRHGRTDQARRRTARINAVLHGDALHMHYQPIIDVHEGRLLGAEALARFAAKPVRAPHRWFAEAEQVGLGVELEVAAVRAAGRGLAELPDECYLSVNVSAAALQAPAGVAVLAGLPAHRLVVELTEHVRIADYDGFAAGLAPLRAAGVRLAVDDSGDGLARLRHIARLQPQIVKMGRALTQGVDTDAAQRAQSAALVRFASDIDASVIAEGVETAAELATVRELGIDAAQGYLLGRPQPLPLPSRGFTRLEDMSGAAPVEEQQ